MEHRSCQRLGEEGVVKAWEIFSPASFDVALPLAGPISRDLNSLGALQELRLDVNKLSGEFRFPIIDGCLFKEILGPLVHDYLSCQCVSCARVGAQVF